MTAVVSVLVWEWNDSPAVRQEQNAIVVVHVEEARNLPPMDSNGLADPYCLLALSKTKLKGGRRSRASSPTGASSDALAASPSRSRSPVPPASSMPHSPARLHPSNGVAQPPERDKEKANESGNDLRSGGSGGSADLQPKPKKAKEHKGPFGWIRRRANSRSSSKTLKLKSASKERAAAIGQLTAPSTPSATPQQSPQQSPQHLRPKADADRASLSQDIGRFRSPFSLANDSGSFRLQDSCADLRSSRELCPSNEQLNLNSNPHTRGNTPLASPRPSLRNDSFSTPAAAKEHLNRSERAVMCKRAQAIQRQWMQQLAQLHLQHQREDRERQAHMSARTHKKRRPSVGEAAIAATAALTATAFAQETVAEAVETVAKGGFAGPDGGLVFRTRIHYRTLHPIWKETFYLYAYAAAPSRPPSRARTRARPANASH